MTAPAWGGIRCDPAAFNQKGKGLTMPTHKSILRDVKRAYQRLDDARALLEEILEDTRDATQDEGTGPVPNLEEIMIALDEDIQSWIGALHPISEDMLDWAGRDDD